jgi:acyl CoA:acetate/3-ketoacid CoA transferase alpha subunit
MQMLKKLSLAALVAMGSMSVASATDLSEAIKGVNINGFLRYRYTENSNKINGQADHKNVTKHEYKAVVGIDVKASEELSVHGTLVYLHKNTTNDEGNGVHGADPLNVKESYVKYNANGITAKFGQQFLKTPLSDADVSRGNGLLATYTQSGITVAGAYMDGVDTVTNNLYVLAAIADIKPAKVQAWYYNLTDSGSDTKDGASAYFLEASANVDIATVKAQYASKKGNGDDDKRQKFFAMAATANVDTVSATVAYLNFGKDGSDVEVSSQADGLIAAGDIAGDLIQQGAFTDGYGAALVLSTKVTDKAKAGVQYVHATSDNIAGGAKTKYNEYDLDLSYAYNKKFSVSAYYAILKTDVEDSSADQTKNQGRVELKYKF